MEERVDNAVGQQGLPAALAEHARWIGWWTRLLAMIGFAVCAGLAIGIVWVLWASLVAGTMERMEGWVLLLVRGFLLVAVYYASAPLRDYAATFRKLAGDGGTGDLVAVLRARARLARVVGTWVIVMLCLPLLMFAVGDAITAYR
jgi:hypothetical protein